VISYRVTMSGRAAGRGRFPVDESPAPQADAVAASEAAAPWIRYRDEPPTWMRFVSDWLANLPRPIVAIIAVACFLGLINVFSGSHRIWFHWPVVSLLFIIVLWKVLRRQPASDSKEDRRTGRE
jgi:adenylate cyclase